MEPEKPNASPLIQPVKTAPVAGVVPPTPSVGTPAAAPPISSPSSSPSVEVASAPGPVPAPPESPKSVGAANESVKPEVAKPKLATEKPHVKSDVPVGAIIVAIIIFVGLAVLSYIVYTNSK